MDDASRLAALREKLRSVTRKNLATQQQLEKQTGVDQTTISRIMNGHRRRFRQSFQKLEKYADMLLSTGDIPPAVQQATKEFLTVGTETELLASIHLARELVAHRLR